MYVLVTNDDGYESPGLWHLARVMAEFGGVLVVAPNEQHSGVGTSVTLRRGLEIAEIESDVPSVPAYHVNGTPADCVILGLRKLARGHIDLVVSGINYGANLGNDVLVSGTVGGALQGHFRGIPSIAFSLDVAGEPHWDTAAVIARLLGQQAANGCLPEEYFLNVNVPALPMQALKGIAVTHVARGGYIRLMEHPRSGTSELRREVHVTDRPGYPAGTDIRAIVDGHVSISPLQGNPTNHAQIDNLTARLDGLFHQLQVPATLPD
jgi:5'-nucleotidase